MEEGRVINGGARRQTTGEEGISYGERKGMIPVKGRNKHLRMEHLFTVEECGKLW